MPRAKKSPETGKPNKTTTERQIDPEWGGFLNLKLDEADKERFGTWYAAAETTVGSLLDDAMIDGLKVSIAYDTENECYIATFTGKLIPAHDTRYAASARAGTYWEAVALMCYKHFVVCEGNWFDFLPHNGKLARWG